MLITLIGFGVVAGIAFVGYSRGLYRILAAFISFLLAGLLAKVSSGLVEWPVRLSEKVPETLVPLASQLLAGILLFLLFYLLANKILNNPKVAAVALDNDLYWELKDVDLGKILKEVLRE